MNKRQIRLPVDTGVSGWLALCERQMPLSVLQGAKTADWLIIGAGFAGVSAARRLAQLCPGDRIVVLDAKEVGEGPAGRNMGFMIDLPHSSVARNYAKEDDKAQQNEIAAIQQEIATNRHAIGFARAAAEEYGMAHDTFSPVGKINAAVTERGQQKNAELARSLDLLGEPYEFLDAQSMTELTGSSCYRGGLRTPGAVVIQPAAYMRSFAAGLSSVAEIHENSPVVSLSRDGGLWTAVTPHGSVKAPKVIMAVNGHIQDFGHFQRRLMHVFTYASMTAAIQPGTDAFRRTGAGNWGLLPSVAMGATIRKISGPDWSRIVVRTRFTYDPCLKVSERRVARVAAEHRRKFALRHPDLADIPFEYNWAGRLCLSLNKVPAFGEIEEGLYSACCDNGLGTVKSTLAGMLAAELATSTPSKLLDEYSAQPEPGRIPPPPFDYLGINAVLQWRHIRAGAEN